ncbi:hypothetical protein [Legionella jordanis]|uniref:hypothetical protein n=1 Tax=Legionella jordanis TaxID=456 RepID=UPI001604BCDB|nr:hypothetical protein [Legionella jordanis]
MQGQSSIIKLSVHGIWMSIMKDKELKIPKEAANQQQQSLKEIYKKQSEERAWATALEKDKAGK